MRPKQSVESDKRDLLRGKARNGFKHRTKSRRRFSRLVFRVCFLGKPERMPALVKTRGARTEVICTAPPVGLIESLDQPALESYDNASVNLRPSA